MAATTQMLNWLCRYALVTPVVLGRKRELSASLLDAGSGPHGFACVDPGSPFVGMDMQFPLPAGPSMLAVRNGPGRLPFADASFDTVISLDVLEHVPPADRTAFVDELARVSANRVVVACPSSEMGPIDDLVRAVFVRSGQEVPGWLSEHDEFGLPTPAEIAECCAEREGFSSRPLPVPNGLFSTMASLADFIPEVTPHATLEATANARQWVELFEAASFGDSWRKAYLLERSEPAGPHVDQADLEPTLLRALRCQACGGRLERLGPSLLRCGGCAHLVARDTMRAWDVRPESKSLWCSPEWRPDALSQVLRGFADLNEGNASLQLHAPPGSIGAEDALACAAAALDGRELPDHVDVAIVTDSPHPGPTATVIEASALELFSQPSLRA
ncbi:MAG: class I SAM-dependent methyltransferase [Thermoleophilaceae bacterium]